MEYFLAIEGDGLSRKERFNDLGAALERAVALAETGNPPAALTDTGQRTLLGRNDMARLARLAGKATPVDDSVAADVFGSLPDETLDALCRWLLVRLRAAGASPRARLAVIGGIGLSLADLVQAYAALANGGNAVTLSDGVNGARAPYRLSTVLTAKAAWQVGDILAGVPAPATSASRAIAYKTGTSYGYRDAWSIGFDGRYVLGVWVGRADNGPVPGSTGGGVAAPILFEAFARSGLKPAPFRAAPRGAGALAAADLPQGLKRFVPKTAALVPVAGATEGPEIVYPPQGARVELANVSDGEFSPLVLKLQGGKAPFRWIANGQPLDGIYRRRTASWVPDGKGFSKLTVIDAAGKATTVDVLVQ